MDSEKTLDRSNISNCFGTFRVSSNKYPTTPNKSPLINHSLIVFQKKKKNHSLIFFESHCQMAFM